MNMGSYTAPPVMLSGAGGKMERGGVKNRGYSQYGNAAYGYGPAAGGWGEHHMGGAFYGPSYGVHMPMMRGHMMDPAAMEYMADQFQGQAL